MLEINYFYRFHTIYSTQFIHSPIPNTEAEDRDNKTIKYFIIKNITILACHLLLPSALVYSHVIHSIICCSGTLT